MITKPGEQPRLTGAIAAPEFYVDGFQGVVVANGVAKLNFFSVAFDTEAGAAANVCALRLALSLTALISVRDALSALVADLEKDGVVLVEKRDVEGENAS